MSANQINIRRKEIKKKNYGKMSLLIGLIVVAVLGIVLLSAFFAFGDRFNFASANLEISASGKNKIIRVPKGANLQEAIDKADGGDIIELEAGAVYENITLPKKDISDFITIRSSKADQLPENKRVSPAQANLMAKIVTRKPGIPAVEAEKAAHHYRFVGIEFTTQTDGYIYNLIFLGEPDTIKETAHHFEFDRCFVHSGEKGISRRGLAVNSADTNVTNSYFQGFAFPGQETQGICGWTGTKNVKIINNYIEGGAENIMFGGSEPKSADLIPSDIEVRGNHLNKPAEWKDQKNAMKCLFELKNSKRVDFIGNYLENNWVGAAFRITVRNENGGAPFSTIEDTVIKDNFINGAGEGINILSSDNNYPSQTLKNLKIVNNLLINIGTEEFEDSSGYFIQISSGINVLIANNTSINRGNIASVYGEMPKNFIFRDNIVAHNQYGIHGFEGLRTAAGQKVFQNNVFVNNRNIPQSDTSFPTNNFWITDYNQIGFVNFSQNDFRLAPTSRFKGKGTDKTDIGANLNVKEIIN